MIDGKCDSDETELMKAGMRIATCKLQRGEWRAAPSRRASLQYTCIQISTNERNDETNAISAEIIEPLLLPSGLTQRVCSTKREKAPLGAVQINMRTAAEGSCARNYTLP